MKGLPPQSIPEPRSPVIRLPGWVPPIVKPTVTRLAASRIKRISERRVPVAGENAILPEAFGRCFIARPRIFAIAQNSTSAVVLGMVWCRGEMDTINGFYAGNAAFAGTVTHYLGTAGQTADPTLASAISGYADDLAGICYSVVTLAETDLLAGLVFSIDIQGRKLYDPRTATTVSTDSFALMYRYVAVQAGLTVDDDSIIAAADFGEEDVGGYARWSGGLLFDAPVAIDDQLALIAEYAGCFHVREAGTVKLIPDRETATTATFSDQQADIDAGAGMIVAGSLRMTKKSLDQIPNQVSVQYMDSSKIPWRTAYAETDVPGGDLRLTTYNMIGFRDYNTAYRYAVERQNRFNLCDLSLDFEGFDEGLPVEIGDVVEVTHSVGLTSKKIRVQDVQAGSDVGHWNIIGEEYDPAVYSSTVSSEPTYSDITLPDPADVPDGPAITSVAEVLYLDETGHTYSRFRIKFDGIDWPWVAQYRIKVSDGTDIILEQPITHRGAGIQHIAVTSAVTQDVTYTIEIWAINIFGKAGANPSSTSQTGNGKILPPTDVANLTGYEAGQFVNLSWTAAIDLDLRGYQIRRLAATLYVAGSGWDHASAVVLAERVDATQSLVPFQPVGSYYYMIKAVDIAGNESVNAAAVAVTVTSDFAGQQVIEYLDYVANYAGVYASFESSPTVSAGAAATASFAAVPWVGDQSLMVVANAANGLVWMGANATDYNITIPPNKSWVISAYVRLVPGGSPLTSNNVQLYLKSSAGTFYNVTGSVADDAAYHRVQGVLDLSADASTALILRVDNDSYNSAGDTTMRFDGLMLELDDGSGLASPWEDGLGSPGGVATNMHVYELHGNSGGRYAVSSSAETFADKFTAGQAFSDVYSASERFGADENIASSIQFNEWDTGADKQGNWNWAATIETFGGTVAYTTSLAKAADYPTFTDYSGQSVNGSAEYMIAKADLSAALGNGFKIELPVPASHQGKILEQNIDSTLTTSQPLAVTYPIAYASAPEVTPKYQGVNPYFAVADNITNTGFDLYLWDSATGAAVAGAVRTTAIGT